MSDRDERAQPLRSIEGEIIEVGYRFLVVGVTAFILNVFYHSVFYHSKVRPPRLLLSHSNPLALSFSHAGSSRIGSSGNTSYRTRSSRMLTSFMRKSAVVKGPVIVKSPIRRSSGVLHGIRYVQVGVVRIQNIGNIWG